MADLTLLVMGRIDGEALREAGIDWRTPVVVLTGTIEEIRELGALLGQTVRVGPVPAPSGPDDGEQLSLFGAG